MSKHLKIKEFKDITPPGKDGHRYKFTFEVGEMEEGGFFSENEFNINVDISRTLQSIWGVDDQNIATVTGSTATSLLVNTASEGLSNFKDIDLNTFSAPREPNTWAVAYPGAVIPIPGKEEIQKEIKEMTSISMISEDISSIRDHINAISKNTFGERILELPQERALLDAYKSAKSEEEFKNRVQSIATISTAFNKKMMGEKLGKKDVESIGSIVLLQQFLNDVSNESDLINEICDIYKKINDMRKGYPTHGDNVDRVLESYDYFGLDYPVTAYDASWDVILGKYKWAMNNLLTLLSNVRKKLKEDERRGE